MFLPLEPDKLTLAGSYRAELHPTAGGTSFQRFSKRLVSERAVEMFVVDDLSRSMAKIQS